MSQLLTEKDVAKQLQVTAWTLQNWRSRGQGPKYVKLGRIVRYRQTDIDNWIENNG